MFWKCSHLKASQIDHAGIALGLLCVTSAALLLAPHNSCFCGVGSLLILLCTKSDQRCPVWKQNVDIGCSNIYSWCHFYGMYSVDAQSVLNTQCNRLTSSDFIPFFFFFLYRKIQNCISTCLKWSTVVISHKMKKTFWAVLIKLLMAHCL